MRPTAAYDSAGDLSKMFAVDYPPFLSLTAPLLGQLKDSFFS